MDNRFEKQFEKKLYFAINKTNLCRVAISPKGKEGDQVYRKH